MMLSNSYQVFWSEIQVIERLQSALEFDILALLGSIDFVFAATKMDSTEIDHSLKSEWQHLKSTTLYTTPFVQRRFLCAFTFFLQQILNDDFFYSFFVFLFSFDVFFCFYFDIFKVKLPKWLLIITEWLWKKTPNRTNNNDINKNHNTKRGTNNKNSRKTAVTA